MIRKVVIKISLVALLVLLVQMSYAQFTLSGEIRPRAEYRHGYRQMPIPDSAAAAFISQRTRLNLDFANESFKTHISFQDVRVWGQMPQRQYEPSVELHHGWVELLLTDSLSIRAGRQPLLYDNQRFLAINNWIQPAQKHDVLLLMYMTPLGTLHFGTAFNQPGGLVDRNFHDIGTRYTVDNYKYMNFLWLNGQILPSARLSLLGMLEGYENRQSLATYLRATYSAYFILDAGKTQIMLNPAFQHGQTVDSRQIEAFYLGSNISREIMPGFRSTLGIEYLSGNSPHRADNIFRAFDPSLGSGHAFGGHMDYFTNYPRDTDGAGLINPFLINSVSIGKRATLDTDIHLFYLANDFIHENAQINRYLGWETDFTFVYHLSNQARLDIGYSMMFGTPGMEVIKGGSSDEWADWAYVMLTVRPVFFRSGS